MPQFINPSSQDENISSYEGHEELASFTERRINIINLKDGAVSYSRSSIGSNRSLLINSYDYEQHLRADEYDESSSETPEGQNTSVDDKSNHRSRHSFAKKTHLCIILVSLCAFVTIVYIGLENRSKGNSHCITIKNMLLFITNVHNIN